LKTSPYDVKVTLPAQFASEVQRVLSAAAFEAVQTVSRTAAMPIGSSRGRRERMSGPSRLGG
jgi:hypothetical protein